MKNTKKIKLLERTGQITHKELKKVYDKRSVYYGNDHYRLTVNLEQLTRPTHLFVYQNVVSPRIWQTIHQSQYVDKRYLFFCEKRSRGFMLHNWRELTRVLI
jgi:hypothetical protein